MSQEFAHFEFGWFGDEEDEFEVKAQCTKGNIEL